MSKVFVPEDQVRFFSGSSNPALAAAIASELGVPLDDTRITRFSNDNLYIQLGATVRYRRVYIVQSLSQPAQWKRRGVRRALIRAPSARVPDASKCPS